MDIDKVRELTDTELTDELVKQRRHLYDLRFQLATRQLTDYSQLTQARRTIARILTVQTEREATGAGPVPSTRGDKEEQTSRRRLGVRRRSATGAAADEADQPADEAPTATATRTPRKRTSKGSDR
jgi:large subunit ribosomal protein L29